MIGRQLAHYTITAHLGSGGMGDVYQATDTKLGRSVALKFLPEAVAHDVESTTRFRREAKTLASLNHPHIAAIHGLEESDGKSFLVMELVPGQTLAERIARRPIPLDEALSIARQIVEGLEAAHEKGIVHRDLKPANVKITPDGRVKVLDFGLAKRGPDITEESDPQSLTQAPTRLATATQRGTILGTPTYMAPEQARGLPVDRRADLFAFGCILYEMLSGRRAFDGESGTEVISRVLQREPDWTRLPSTVPPSVHRLIRLCLEKDPRKRRQAAGDVRIDLEQALNEPAVVQPTTAARPSILSRVLWSAGAVALFGVLAVPAVRHLREAPPPEMRLQIVTPPALDPFDFALSPDGRYVVFAASESSNAPQRLYLRARDQVDAHPMTGTEGARLPFWSPDSRSVGFFASGKLYRIDIAGGPAQALATAGVPMGGTWNSDGTILFTPNTVSPVFRVPSVGGEKAIPATQLDSPRQNNHRAPSFLPNGRQFLFFVPGESEVSGLFLGSLDGNTPPKRLTAGRSHGAYLAPDRIVYLQDGALVARRFDAAKSELTGDPITLVSSSSSGDPIGGFSVSADGTLAYRTGRSAPRELVWVDRKGNILEQFGELSAPDLSFDGKRLAFDRTSVKESNRDVWLKDLVRGGETRFTFDPKVDGYPVWSPEPEARRVAFESNRNGSFDLWIKASSGAADTEELLYSSPDNEWPLDWSNDGRFLLYTKTDAYYAASDLLALPMTGDDRMPIVIADTLFEERRGEFSPDGNWVVYDTDESGKSEVVVQAFPKSNGTVHVSTAGGAAPRWRADGKEIYFIAPDGKMMAARVSTTGSTISPEKPVALFPTHLAPFIFRHEYVAARDGRFLILDRQVQPVPPIVLILNGKF
jgi:serine/threonine protein kinase/Tol biopolymer transport system component